MFLCFNQPVTSYCFVFHPFVLFFACALHHMLHLFIFAMCVHADSSLTPSMRRDYYRGSTDSLAERQRSEERQSRMRPGRSYSLVRGEAWL